TEVQALFEADPVPSVQLVSMSPGDIWDDRTGFSIAPNDWYTHRTEHTATLAAKAAPSIETSLAAEAERSIDFGRFKAHFEKFLRELPPLTWLTIRRPVVFHVPGHDQPYWTLDFRRRQVTASERPPADRASVIKIPEGVLADAVDNRIVDFVY